MRQPFVEQKYAQGLISNRLSCDMLQKDAHNNIREFLGHPADIGGGDVAAVPLGGLFARNFQGKVEL